jgi:hypothetical protein
MTRMAVTRSGPRRRALGLWNRRQRRSYAAVPLVLLLLVSSGCNRESEPTATDATSDGIEVGAGPVDPEVVEAFRGQRDAICTEGSVKVGQVPAATSGASAADIVDGLLRLERRIEQTQQSLAELEVPEELASFVMADEQRREERLQVIGQLIEAVRDGDEGLATTLQQELNTLGAEAQAAEEANDLEHCP